MTGKKEPALRREDRVSVWNAPDEAAATAVRDFLVEQGIEAAAVPVQIAWLGGVETLVSEPRLTSHASLTPAERDAQGIPDGFLRVSLGIEDVVDLIADFEQALAAR